MSALTIDDVKAHIKPDGDQDAYLELLMRTARRSAENYIDRPIVEDEPDEDVINTAMLLLIGHWFANREAVSVGTQKAEMPLAVEWLLGPVKSWSC